MNRHSIQPDLAELGVSTPPAAPAAYSCRSAGATIATNCPAGIVRVIPFRISTAAPHSVSTSSIRTSITNLLKQPTDCHPERSALQRSRRTCCSFSAGCTPPSTLSMCTYPAPRCFNRSSPSRRRVLTGTRKPPIAPPVCFGDSITAGYAFRPARPIRLLAAKTRFSRYHYRVNNQGTSGATPRTPSPISAHPAAAPEVVIVEFAQ